MIFQRVIRYFLMMALLLTALSKLFADQRGDQLLPRSAHLGIAFAEIVVAILLCVRQDVIAAWSVVVLSLCGAVSVWAWPSKTCGCLGSFAELSRTEHLLLAGGLGFFASLLLLISPRPRKSAHGLSTS